jgi:hypothetical protein
VTTGHAWRICPGVGLLGTGPGFDMHVPNYNACQHAEECMSTCIRNFNMHVKENYMSKYKKNKTK